jgi:outer membrane protein TolC
VFKEDDLVEAGAELKRLINMDQAESLGDVGRPDIDFSGVMIEELRMSGIDDAPEVVMLDRRYAAAQHDLSLARMDWIPDLKLRLFMEEMDMAMGRHKTRGAMVAVNVPVWAWRNRAKIDGKQSMLRQADFDLEAAADMVEQSLEKTLASFESTRKSYDLFENSVIPEAELAYTSAVSAYETGKVDILSLLSSQRALREARLAHLKLWAKLVKDLAEIERITGRRFY